MNELYADFRDGKVEFSEDFELLLQASYVFPDASLDANMAKLAQYLVWHAWLEKISFSCQPTPAFINWIFEPSGTEDGFFSFRPLLPRAALASTTAFPYCGGKELLKTESGRFRLLWWFHGNFSTLLRGFHEPSWILAGFEPEHTRSDVLPVMLEAYWHFTKKLQYVYDIASDVGRTAFLDWCVRNRDLVFPNGCVPNSVIAKLWEPASKDTGEGLTKGLEARAAVEGKSLNTRQQRMQYVSSQFVKFPQDAPLWSWNAICAPHAEMPELPNLALMLDATSGAIAEYVENTDYLQTLGNFLAFYLGVADRYPLPGWLKENLRKFSSSPGAEDWGVSLMMEAFGAVNGLDKKNMDAFIANYAVAIDSMPASLWPYGKLLLKWRKKGVEFPDTAFFHERKQDCCTVLGWPDGCLGLGEDSRSLHAALKEQNIHCSLATVSGIVPYFGQPHPAGKDVLDRPQGMFSIYSLAAQDIYRLRQLAPEEWWRGRYNIGFCPWELSTWPKSASCWLECLDEIWAPSEFVAHAFEGFGIPVRRVPMPILPLKPTGDWRAKLNIPDDAVVFMTSYDSHASYPRKNPSAVLDAFNKAFEGQKDEAYLVIKTMNANGHAKEWNALRERNKCGDKVIFMDCCLARQENIDLLNTCDVFVSLHRSEGFGRLLAEAMLLGKLVVSSDYGGSRDFAKTDTACLVPGKETAVREHDYLFWEGQYWFEADIDYAGDILLDIGRNKNKYKTLADNGKIYVSRQHSCYNVGIEIVKNLVDLGFNYHNGKSCQ